MHRRRKRSPLTHHLSSQEASRDDDATIYVVVHNALAQVRSEAVPLPVDSDYPYAVEWLQDDMEWLAVDSTLLPNKNYANVLGAAPFTLYFHAIDLPPLGASVFRIGRSQEMAAGASSATLSPLQPRVMSLLKSIKPSGRGDARVSRRLIESSSPG